LVTAEFINELISEIADYNTYFGAGVLATGVIFMLTVDAFLDGSALLCVTEGLILFTGEGVLNEAVD
jgi:hypothetical protein